MAVVTIARQLGSGGGAIAREVARELNAPYYDKEVIGLAAARLGISEEVAASEVADRPLVNRLINTLLLREPAETSTDSQGAATAAAGRHITSTAYRSVLEEVVRELAGTGSAVIAGRAGQVILQSMPHVVHIFITAPPAARVERVMRERGIDRAAAERLIDASDQDRAGYLLAEYGAAWQSPHLYSLTVNTGQCTTATAVAAIVGAARVADLVRPHTASRRLRQEIYTVPEAAALLMMHPEIIRHAIFDHELPARRVGNDLLLIHRHDLISWMEQRALIGRS